MIAPKKKKRQSILPLLKYFQQIKRRERKLNLIRNLRAKRKNLWSYKLENLAELELVITH